MVKDALLARIAEVQFMVAINGYTTWASAPTRRLKLFNAIDPSMQPAAFVVQHREGYNQRGAGLPPRRWLECGVWCYAPTGDPSVIGDDLLDLMETAIEDVLGPDDPVTNNLTFGGLCEWCKVDRESNLFIRDPGDLDGQALLVLPVRILLP